MLISKVKKELIHFCKTNKVDNITEALHVFRFNATTILEQYISKMDKGILVPPPNQNVSFKCNVTFCIPKLFLILAPTNCASSSSELVIPRNGIWPKQLIVLVVEKFTDLDNSQKDTQKLLQIIECVLYLLCRCTLYLLVTEHMYCVSYYDKQN